MNASTFFQISVGRVLAGHESHCMFYIDDVIVFSLSWADHLIHLDMILTTIVNRGLTIKSDECVWKAHSLKYLGCILGHGRLSVLKACVKAIQAFVKSITIKEFRPFLGVVSYYCQFIPDFGRTVVSHSSNEEISMQYYQMDKRNEQIFQYTHTGIVKGHRHNSWKKGFKTI